jgi:hypothetical protein
MIFLESHTLRTLAPSPRLRGEGRGEGLLATAETHATPFTRIPLALRAKSDLSAGGER